jgi:hypothetical protein
MPRVQAVVLPLLRAGLAEAYPTLHVSTWVPDVDHRTFPLLNVRRLGGISTDPRRLELAVIEMTAFSADGLVATENLYLDARHVLVEAQAHQTVTEQGYIHSFFETMGPTQFDSTFDDTWRIQGLIQLGVRPRRGS